MSGAKPDAAKTVRVGVVIVTYASGKVLPRALAALEKQTRKADQVVIVDNCSPDPSFLDSIPVLPEYQIIRSATNSGFCGGNNLGFAATRQCHYVLLLNPDAFLEPEFIERAVEWMEAPSHSDVGTLTGTLLGFDLDANRPSGRIDSLGIFQTWYGRWYDKGQGDLWAGCASEPAEMDVPAICGALMFCRTKALTEASLGPEKIFDERFFMYKEDIDLSLRLRAHGWRLVRKLSLLCYHARGWQHRSRMPARMKYLSARNELRVCLRNRGRGLPYTLLKLAYVRIIERSRA